jgi:ornithine cyclodeaminase/alanine dehydrogenase-like protein (mu-crystallin family)
VFPDNAAKNLATVPATILLFDELTGLPVALMDGTYLTGLRTAAGSAAVYQTIRKQTSPSPSPLTLTVFGSGLQAQCHVDALLHVLHRDTAVVDSVVIVNRSKERATGMIETLLKSCVSGGIAAPSFKVISLDDKDAVKEAVSKSRLIVTATNSR